MLVSWNWLKEYVPLEGISPAEAERRLMMAGLNHESTQEVGGDLAVDLEITSNRPDCLGHVGVAREIAVLFERPLTLPAAGPRSVAPPAERLTSVAIECPDLCRRYIARVIRGVKVGPSPAWMVERLRTIGIAAINNVVDATNYVLMECGQPLHAFDLARLGENRIVVRRGRGGETIEAIDHRTYALDANMCVIADARRAVAIGGVMGGASSEVGQRTTDLLIESAEFAPFSIRATARKLGLHSPSSYRFERGVDPEGVDWASRRCCELIAEIAGGEVSEGSVEVGQARPSRPPIVLRLAEIERVLGICVPEDRVGRILAALGHGLKANAPRGQIVATPPSWRRDLEREVDLIEEVARIHGYDAIPEDVAVPMCPSHRTREDLVIGQARRVAAAAGFDEALTVSLVTRELAGDFHPWTSAEPVVAQTPILRGADRLRLSLVPSLLESRRLNESLGNADADLFETARVYGAASGSAAAGQIDQSIKLALVGGGDFFQVKEVVVTLLGALRVEGEVELAPFGEEVRPLLDGTRQTGFWWKASGDLPRSKGGYVGELSPKALKKFGLHARTTVAEVDLGELIRRAVLTPRFQELSPFPAIVNDLNLVVDETVGWQSLESTVRSAGGSSLERVEYRETYRDPKKDGEGKKRVLLAITLRSVERTLTGDEAESIRGRILSACQAEHGARLLA